MEKNEVLDTPLTDLKINVPASGYLITICGWAKFLGILGFILSGIMFIGGIFSSVAMSGFTGGAAGVFVLSTVVISTISFFPSLWLYRFGVNSRDSINLNDQELLEKGLRNLKNFFVFQGIAVLIIIGIYLLLLISVGI